MNKDNTSTYDKTLAQINLKELLGLVMADIDEFLLIDDNKNYSVEEIRGQLESTMSKFMSFYEDDFSPIYSASIYPAIKFYLFFNNPLISKAEKLKQLSNSLDEDGYLKFLNH